MTEIPAKPIQLWAPIVKTRRNREWIFWTCVRPTRHEAIREFLRGTPDAMKSERLSGVRFAKVTIAEAAKATGPAKPKARPLEDGSPVRS